jgi:hypothetical protein
MANAAVAGRASRPILLQVGLHARFCCRSGFTPAVLEETSGINPDQQPDCVTLFGEDQ